MTAPPLQLIGPLLRLSAKARRLSLQLSAAARARIIAAYPPYMRLLSTRPETLFVMLCNTLEETWHRMVRSLGQPAAAGSAARPQPAIDPAACRSQLMEAAISLARYMRMW